MGVRNRDASSWRIEQECLFARTEAGDPVELEVFVTGFDPAHQAPVASDFARRVADEQQRQQHERPPRRSIVRNAPIASGCQQAPQPKQRHERASTDRAIFSAVPTAFALYSPNRTPRKACATA